MHAPNEPRTQVQARIDGYKWAAKQSDLNGSMIDARARIYAGAWAENNEHHDSLYHAFAMGATRAMYKGSPQCTAH